MKNFLFYLKIIGIISLLIIIIGNILLIKSHLSNLQQNIITLLEKIQNWKYISPIIIFLLHSFCIISNYFSMILNKKKKSLFSSNYFI